MLVSQFELLINKNQFPEPADLPVPLPGPVQAQLGELSREVLQGYFLEVSNLSNQAVNLFVSFQIVTDSAESPFNNNNVVAVFDIDGNNQIIPLIAPSSYVINVPAQDTGLLIVQPNPRFITSSAREVEIRGYVDISLISHESNEEINLLLTPEHRGTFYRREPAGGPTTFSTLDQIAYGLPTPHGGSLFTLSPCVSH